MPLSGKPDKYSWCKDAIIYELSVRAFFDSNGDGIGDFPGLLQKLDYLEDLGVNTLWLLPFYPSPLHDDGYDLTEYCDVHPAYGTLNDFKVFLKEAHRRGIRVITELIINHTSDQHPWFKKARRSRQGSRAREYYVWSDNTTRYAEARIMMPDAENTSNWTWDAEAGAYYWHRFGRYLPELNYENPEVQMEIIKAADFWLKLGVDGFRLPSVPFLYEAEGSGCENLPETHAFVKKLRAYIDKHYEDRVLIGEANLWPEDAASYFGEGDECHMNFHYPLMPRLFLALRTEDSFPVVDIMEQTPDIPTNTQWALFLRNHDELGLEMVTDEEKDYLFKAYAFDPNSKFNVGINRRLAPLLNNDRRKIELLHVILFSLPGSPVMYYGDEVGMGDNVYLGGRAAVRTPMQWNMNLNAGFSEANPQRLFLPVITDPVYRHESVNVITQEDNSSSLLWWMKNLIAMRKRLTAFGWGNIKFIESTNAKVLCFARAFAQQHIIVVVNLSQFSQAATLDLKAFKDRDITEAFSQNRFKNIGQGEYDITIGPYGYYWLQADKGEREDRLEASGELALLRADLSWERLFNNSNEVRLVERKILQPFLRRCRWFGGRNKVVSKTNFLKIFPLKVGNAMHYVTVIEVHYVQRLPELYFLPMTFVASESMMDRTDYSTQSMVCRAEIQHQTGFVIDSSYDKPFRDYLFTAMTRSLTLREGTGELSFEASLFTKMEGGRQVDSKLLKADDQRNTSMIYNDRYFLKFYRRLEREVNPEQEVIRYLSEHTSFQYSPRYTGSLTLKEDDGSHFVLGLMQEKVEHQGDAWNMTFDSVGRFYERVLTSPHKEKVPTTTPRPVTFEEAPAPIQELIGRGFYERIIRLGQRTAELHLALFADTTDPAFIQEPFTPNYQRSMYSSLRKLVRDRFGLLESLLPKLNADAQRLGREILDMEANIIECFSEIHKTKIQARKIRIHGDCHLGQVLFTGNDFVFIDFKGEPGLSYSERRLKRNPLKDVAGMMRSIHYAAYGKILLNENYRARDLEILEAWAEQWQHYINRFYLVAYLERRGMDQNLSQQHEILLRTFLLEKAIQELGNELNGRPDWAIVPLRGIDYLMRQYRER